MNNVCAPLAVNPDLQELLSDLSKDIIDLLEPLPFKAMDDLHISLSRTFAVRHHWIEPLVASLRRRFKACCGVSTDLGRIKSYTNDEKTR